MAIFRNEIFHQFEKVSDYVIKSVTMSYHMETNTDVIYVRCSMGFILLELGFKAICLCLWTALITGAFIGSLKKHRDVTVRVSHIVT